MAAPPDVPQRLVPNRGSDGRKLRSAVSNPLKVEIAFVDLDRKGTNVPGPGSPVDTI